MGAASSSATSPKARPRRFKVRGRGTRGRGRQRPGVQRGAARRDAPGRLRVWPDVCAGRARHCVSAPAGASSGSSTKMAPFFRSPSTTCRLCTISWRTYTGWLERERARSTISMARSTPAQNPRGLARIIFTSFFRRWARHRAGERTTGGENSLSERAVAPARADLHGAVRLRGPNELAIASGGHWPALSRIGERGVRDV